VLLTLAIFVPVSEFNRLDLPTLDLPRKAISGADSAGNCCGDAADVRNLTLIFMSQNTVPQRGKKSKRPALAGLSILAEPIAESRSYCLATG
jgi:hypothetical protein